MNGKLDLIARRFREIKDDHFGAILLLHIGNAYYALYDDALRVACASNGLVQRLHGASSLLYCQVPESLLDTLLERLKPAGCEVVVLDRPDAARPSGGDITPASQDSIFAGSN